MAEHAPEFGKFLLMRTPAHFRRRRAFFPKAFYAPGAHEFIHFLGPIGNLRVALAAMNDFDLSFWPSKLNLRDLINSSSSSLSFPVAFPSAIILFAISISPCFTKCEISPGLAPWSTTAVGAFFRPVFDHFAEFHLPPVKRFFKRTVFK